MKKKGLLISTIVMVVVLVASLTTATYAWFNVSSELSVQGFQLQVVPNTAVAIGLCKTGGGYKEEYNKGDFVSGTVHYGTGTGSDGKLSLGWTGDVQTLGASITHELKFGNINKAVGASNGEVLTTTPDKVLVEDSNTGFFSGWTNQTTGLIVAANASDASSSTMGEPVLAKVNSENAGSPSDLVYFHFGVAPTAALKSGTNNVFVVIQVQNGATLGIGAALHVAYRVNGNGTWEDVDVFKYTTAGNLDYNSTLDMANKSIDSTIAKAVNDSGSYLDVNYTPAAGSNPASLTMDGAAEVKIPLELYTNAGENATKLDQVEIIIYIAGDDESAISKAVQGNVTVNVGIFFGAQKAE